MEAGVLPIIREFLSERGFELSEEKTVIPHIEDGFDFLGCNIRWYKDKLLTKLSKKNYKAIVSTGDYKAKSIYEAGRFDKKVKSGHQRVGKFPKA